MRHEQLRDAMEQSRDLRSLGVQRPLGVDIPAADPAAGHRPLPRIPLIGKPYGATAPSIAPVRRERGGATGGSALHYFVEPASSAETK